MMDDYLLLPIALLLFVFAGFTAYSAGEKNRGEVAWFFLGLFFPFIALITVAGLPVAPPKQKRIAKKPDYVPGYDY